LLADANEENLVFTSPHGKPAASTAVGKAFREIITDQLSHRGLGKLINLLDSPVRIAAT